MKPSVATTGIRKEYRTPMRPPSSHHEFDARTSPKPAEIVRTQPRVV